EAPRELPIGLACQHPLALALARQEGIVRLHARRRARAEHERKHDQRTGARAHPCLRAHVVSRLIVSSSALFLASFLRPCSQMRRASSRSPLTQSTSPRCAAISASFCFSYARRSSFTEPSRSPMR